MLPEVVKYTAQEYMHLIYMLLEVLKHTAQEYMHLIYMCY